MARRGASLRTALPALVAAAALGLTACGGGSGGGGGGDVTSLRVLDYYNNEPDKSVYARKLDECGQQAGVTIEREVVPGDSLIQKVLQQASSRTLPDVLMLDNPDLQQIAATGALAPISDFGLSADGFQEGVRSASTFEGQVYGLQPVTNSIGLFYNVDILNQAGITPPKTWDELKTAAAALTQGDRYGIAFSAVADYEGAWQFLPFMWTNGGDETDIASPQTAEALQLWVDLVNSGAASRSVLNWKQADVKDQFAAGNAAMMVNGPWQFPALDKVQGLNYEVVPIPVPRTGESVVAPLGGETWTIPQTGDPARQAKAAEIVACLNTDDNQIALATERTTVPTKTALRDRFVAEVPRMAAFTEIVQTARARTGKLGPEWPAAATRIYTAMQTAITGGAPPLQALEQAQNG
ncbi:carbohydrate ABC transporter substrate-binding protein (CUT1 family) [Pseudonocardia hierapolitana]|uniref:Carbohydrate ABC transporter substrate-binding protein (CUT1 family) n=1 Tax=Pseudonocardia hierapolitana TaxID=1128676 RepID=A0A561SWF7_9PSEU|nr:extracellular solute-binding protein [Pseudonocardia hierapolitana]TWF79196.1 carbohydrate ABC transporter substrate-binding protein (CUT1 family) [Pseudonocardia hierapolitana]